MKESKNFWAWALGLFLCAQILFLIGIQFPRGYDFDEFHYIPAAKTYLAGTGFGNMEHPPLAKALISIGIAIGGDRPFGWRLMSTLFGSLTLLGIFFWARVLFPKNLRLCLFVAGVTLFNSLLFVQARIAMLDTFMEAFLVWGCALFCWAWEKPTAKAAWPGLVGAGICLGLATGCKWFGFVAWFGCLGLAVASAVCAHYRVQGLVDAWPKWRARDAWAALGVIAFVAYFASFLPLYALSDSQYSISRFFTLHFDMWDAQQPVPGNHSYRSEWTQWPLLGRPMWYVFDAEPSNKDLVRGVALIGNPLVMWSGVLAILGCVWIWIRHQTRQAFWIATFFGMFYLSWALIPRKLTFYYYYYPAGMMLALALGYVLRNARPYLRTAYLAATVILFVYFYPILAGAKIAAASFTRWMWFRSWI
jgi:dolichyl-phosphate-mannose--protein O-mannosyl transferase